MSSEVSDTAAMIRSISSNVSTVWNVGLLDFYFFRDECFIGEPFLLLDVSTSRRGYFGGVTLP